MNERHKLALANEFVEARTSRAHQNKYMLNEWHTSVKLDEILKDDKIVSEENKPIIKGIYREIAHWYFHNDGHIIYLNSQEAVTTSFLKRLNIIDPQEMFLNMLNERICAPLYEGFDETYEKWVKSPQYMAWTNKLLNRDGTNAIVRVTPGAITKLCQIPTHPVNEFRRFMDQKGFEVDESKIEAIVKKYELKTSQNTVEPTNTIKLEEDSKNNLASNSATLSIDLAGCNVSKRNSQNLLGSNDNHASNPKKVKHEDSFKKTKQTELTYAQTFEQISSSNNLFVSSQQATSFAAVAAAISNYELKAEDNFQSEECDDGKLALSE